MNRYEGGGFEGGRNKGGSYENAPTGALAGPQNADPKVLAELALEGFPQDVMLFQTLASDPVLLEHLTMVDGVDKINAADLQKRSQMYSKIYRNLRNKSPAHHDIATSDMLEGDSALEAEKFLDGEIAKLTSMRDALRA